MTHAAPSPITDLDAHMHQLGMQARAASRAMARASTRQKNAALLAVATELEAARDTLVAENRKDLEAGAAQGLDEALLDRLELTPARIDDMIEGVPQIAPLTDPIGAITDLS